MKTRLFLKTFLLAVVFIAVSLVSWRVSSHFNLHLFSRKVTTQNSPAAASVTVIRHESPNKTYYVDITVNNDNKGSQISITDSNKVTKPYVITADEAKSLGLNSTSSTYNIIFGKWLDDNNFTLVVIYKNGSKYTFSVNAKTAKGDPSSFKATT